MDTFVLFLLLGLIAIVALVIFLARGSRQEINKIEREREQDTSHTFQPGRANVSREVTLDVRPQHHKGTLRRIAAEMTPLPDMTGVTPTAGKGIAEIIVWVMNPVVMWEDNHDEVYEFEPPLALTVAYSAEDAKATTADDKGIPQLALVLAYKAEDGWKWERLPTRVEPSSPGGAGKLSAKLHTLHPKDPVAIGRP